MKLNSVALCSKIVIIYYYYPLLPMFFSGKNGDADNIAIHKVFYYYYKDG